MNLKLKTALATAVLALASVGSASAAILAGSTINTFGSVLEVPTGPVDQALGLNFLGALGVDNTPDGTISVAAGSTGSFTALSDLGCPFTPVLGGCGTIQDIPLFTAFTPIASFFTVTQIAGALSFDLNTLNVVSRTPAIGNQLASLTISGTGLFHFNGDTAPGIYTLTTQGNGRTSFSASSVTVPEPGSLALLGVAGLGLALARRRKKAS